MSTKHITLLVLSGIYEFFYHSSVDHDKESGSQYGDDGNESDDNDSAANRVDDDGELRTSNRISMNRNADNKSNSRKSSREIRLN